MAFSAHARCVPPPTPHPPLLVREADDSTLPDQQQHLNVRLTSWWLHRSIWQTLGFTWTHRLRCNLSSTLTDVAIGKALCMCVCVCVKVCVRSCMCYVRASVCSLGAKKKEDNCLVQDGNQRSRCGHSRGALFTARTITHPAPENTVPGLPCERTAATVCRARGRDCVLLLAATDKWKKEKKEKEKKKTDKTCKTIIPTLPAQLAYFLRSYFL